MVLFHYFISAFLGGRPMFYLGYLFTDKVTGHRVNRYRDTHGREWMATTIWGWDREPMGRTYGADYE